MRRRGGRRRAGGRRGRGGPRGPAGGRAGPGGAAQSALGARRRLARAMEMEHFIETVRKYPCLWNTTAIEYRDQELKDAAWAEVMKETDLSSGKSPSAAQLGGAARSAESGVPPRLSPPRAPLAPPPLAPPPRRPSPAAAWRLCAGRRCRPAALVIASILLIRLDSFYTEPAFYLNSVT